jgi:hypothetical protein
MSTMPRWSRLRPVHFGLCLIIASATFAVLATGPRAGSTTPPPTWEQLSPATSPSSRILASMADDPGTGQLVLFGGSNNGVYLNDTWTWSGISWTKQSPATSPPARDSASMAYDPGTGQLVLFGGTVNGVAGENDTWTWNGTTWTKQSPATSPPARNSASMAYDSGTGQLLLFGGTSNAVDGENDVWNWNGSTWTKLSPATSPSIRYGASMAYDTATGQLVLFGGYDNDIFLNDTWTWNGTTWNKQSPATSPSARYDAPMAYDTAIGQLVLFGGTLSSSPPESNDTWTWDGTTWTQEAPATSPTDRVLASMAYDSGTGQLVLFGGLTSEGEPNDTWAYLPVTAIPTVSAVSPNSGPVTGGTAISITGTGFPSGAKVTIGQGSGAGVGAIAATNVKVVSSTQITAVTGGGAQAGTWSLFVITTGGTSVANLGDDFTYNHAPAVSAVSPSSGPVTGGTPITITGTGFLSGATVVIGQGNGAGSGAIAATNVKVVSSTQITAVTGGGAKAGTWSLFVTTTGGTSAANLGDDFTYD